MKTCNICNETKTNHEFAKDRNTKDYLRDWCRKCGKTRPKKAHLSVPKDSPPRTCTSCNITKPATEFYYNWKREQFVPRCKPCHCALTNKIYTDKSKFRILQNDSYYRKQYGITLLEVEEMKQKANHKCQICSSDFDTKNRPRVDHCHTTGRVRGLLCHKCNVALGLLQDSADLLRKAADYVLKVD